MPKTRVHIRRRTIPEVASVALKRRLRRKNKLSKLHHSETFHDCYEDYYEWSDTREDDVEEINALPAVTIDPSRPNYLGSRRFVHLTKPYSYYEDRNETTTKKTVTFTERETPDYATNGTDGRRHGTPLRGILKPTIINRRSSRKPLHQDDLDEINAAPQPR